MRSIGPHGLNQHTSARRQGNSIGDHAQDGGAVEALEKSHTLAQRRFEGDFAAHGAFGDRGDLGPLADFGGEFVDTFLTDHGRIHVGQQELLAPPLCPLHDNIDGGVIESGAHPIRDGFCAGGGSGVESNVGGNPRIEPVRRPWLSQGFAGPPEHIFGQNRKCRIADKRCNMRHAASLAPSLRPRLASRLTSARAGIVACRPRREENYVNTFRINQFSRAFAFGTRKNGAGFAQPAGGYRDRPPP